jgi:hypothetical protein
MRMCKHLLAEIQAERKKMLQKVVRLVKAAGNRGIKLDVGAGDNKQAGFLGLDIRPTPNADIVWDCEIVPYPIPDECAEVILVSHLIEHMTPGVVPTLMDEWWRIAKTGGQLWLATPYAGSFGFWQDPTHVHGWNEATATYFDPAQFLFNIYKPKPWKIIKNDWFQHGNMEIIFEKLPLTHGIKTPGGYDAINPLLKDGKQTEVKKVRHKNK